MADSPEMRLRARASPDFVVGLSEACVVEISYRRSVREGGLSLVTFLPRAYAGIIGFVVKVGNSGDLAAVRFDVVTVISDGDSATNMFG